jgi:hypothetical protein
VNTETEDIDLEEIDELLEKSEQEFWNMVGEIESEPPSDKRIQNILIRIKAEELFKESVGFAIDGVGAGVMGVLDALRGLGKKDDKPPFRATKNDTGL